MEASKLLYLIEQLLAIDNAHRFQQIFNEYASAINSLSQAPQQPNNQDIVARNRASFGSANTEVIAAAARFQKSLLEDIEADKFFLRDYASEISALMRDNPFSPVTVAQAVQNLL